MGFRRPIHVTVPPPYFPLPESRNGIGATFCDFQSIRSHPTPLSLSLPLQVDAPPFYFCFPGSPPLARSSTSSFLKVIRVLQTFSNVPTFKCRPSFFCNWLHERGRWLRFVLLLLPSCSSVLPPLFTTNLVLSKKLTTRAVPSKKPILPSFFKEKT